MPRATPTAMAETLGRAHGFKVEFPLAAKAGWRVSRTTPAGCRQIATLPADIVRPRSFNPALIRWQPLRECECAACAGGRAAQEEIHRESHWSRWRERIQRRAK